MAIELGTYRLLAAGEVPHVPDGYGLVGRKVEAGLHGEEAVDLRLRSELGPEGLHVRHRRLSVGGHWLVSLHWCVSFVIIVVFDLPAFKDTERPPGNSIRRL